MRAIVSNMIEIEDISWHVQRFFQDELTFNNPEFEKRKRLKINRYGLDPFIKAYVFSPIINSLKIPVGMLDILKNKFPEIELIYIYGNSAPCDFLWTNKITLMDYQEDAVNAIRNHSGVLLAPAGSGKTIMGLKYIQELDQPTIWLTHTIELLYQAKERAEDLLENTGKIGVIGDSQLDFGDNKLLFATYQSLKMKPELFSRLNLNYNVVVIDEAHHIPSNAFSEVVNQLSMQYKLGLTATPDRKDQLDFLMYLSIGKILHEVPRAILYDDKKLIKPEIKFIFTEYSDNNVKGTSEVIGINAGGERVYWREYQDALYADTKRMQIIADNIFNNISEENYQLVLSESLEYAYRIKKLVEEKIIENNLNGVNVQIVHGNFNRRVWACVESRIAAKKLIAEGKAIQYKYDHGHKIQIMRYIDPELNMVAINNKTRKRIMKDAVNRRIHILFASKLAREGLDLPHFNIGHNISPKKGDQGLKDGSVLEQEIGRIMRVDSKNPNKRAIWYDYVDYECGILRKQYYTRRRVYERLGLKMNGMDKKKHISKVQEFFHKNEFFK